MDLDEGHGCDSISGAQYTADQHDFLEIQAIEDERIDHWAKEAEEDEANDCPDHS